MKAIIQLTCLLLICATAGAQEISNSTFSLKIKKTNNATDSTGLNASSDPNKKGDDNTDVKLSSWITKGEGNIFYVNVKSDETTISKPIQRFDIQNIKATFIAAVNEATADSNAVDLVKNTDLVTISEEEAKKAITAIVSNLEENGPKAGTLSYNEEIDFYKANDKKSGGSAKVDHVIIEFNKGFIENIIAYVTIKDTNVRFANLYPIGFTSKDDYKMLKRMRIFEIYPNPQNGVAKEIIVGDLLNYDFAQNISRRDYCPADGIVLLNKTENPKEVYKDGDKYILSLKAYTDLIGLDTKNNNNGLVQLEFDRRFNTNSTRLGEKSARFRKIVKDYGLFQYVTPAFTIAKIENNKRTFNTFRQDAVTDTAGFFSNKPSYYLTALQLYQYQIFSVGADANILLFDNPTLKYTLEINFGFRYGRVQAADSLVSIDTATGTVATTGSVNEYGINTISFFPEVKLNLFADERYGASFTYRATWQKGYYPLIKQNSFNRETDLLTSTSPWLNQLEIYAFFRPQKTDNTLFFRYRFTNEMGNINRNYHQLQLGYRFFFTTKSKSK